MSRWQEASWEVMHTVRLGMKDETDLQKIADAIDAAYPFGERKYQPYKSWLFVRKAFFSRYSLPMKSTKKVPDGQAKLV